MVCGVTRLLARLGQERAAVRQCLRTRCSRASRESGSPRMEGNSGPSSSLRHSFNQFCRALAVSRRSGVQRSLRPRSEEHTSELQSLMRISYAVFCLKKKKIKNHITHAIYANTTSNHKHIKPQHT